MCNLVVIQSTSEFEKTNGADVNLGSDRDERLYKTNIDAVWVQMLILWCDLFDGFNTIERVENHCFVQDFFSY